VSASRNAPDAPRVTLKTIARALGLDHSTVGYALSGKGTIKDETRRRVVEAAARMGYVPSRAARRVRGSAAAAVGLVVPNVVMGYTELVQHASREARQSGCDLHVSLSEFDHAFERAAVETLLESRVSGIILKTLYSTWNGVPGDHPLRAAAKRATPLVLLGGPLRGSPFAAVATDVAEIGRRLGAHLAARGRREVALLFHQAPPASRNAKRMAEGVSEGLGHRAGRGGVRVVLLEREARSAARARADGVNVHYRAQIDAFLEDGASAAARALFDKAWERSRRPEAIVCQNEMLALGVMAEAVRRGVRIPDDVAVAAADRSYAASFAPLSLTTASVPARSVAREAFRLLADIRSGEAHRDEVRPLAPELVEGDST